MPGSIHQDPNGVGTWTLILYDDAGEGSEPALPLARSHYTIAFPEH